jgi:hypothetical protein
MCEAIKYIWETVRTSLETYTSIITKRGRMALAQLFLKPVRGSMRRGREVNYYCSRIWDTFDGTYGSLETYTVGLISCAICFVSYTQ